MQQTIYTVGHSTRSIEDFLSLLHSNDVKVLVDVRNFPGSKRYPHFNKEVLKTSLSEQGIQYVHMKDLGGRRKPEPSSINTTWRNTTFRGYADYMKTDSFHTTIKELAEIALRHTTAYMVPKQFGGVVTDR